MKRKLIPLLMFCLSFILPSAIFANDIPTFPPTLPFSYNGVTYTNALAKSGNTSSCGGFLNIKDIWYYNKKPTFNIYALTGSVYGTPPTGVVSIGVDHASQAVRFLSQSQTSADNYVATEYPNGVSFGVCSQCYRTRIDPSTVYTNTDIYQYNSTVLFKGANVSTYHQLYVTINPTGGGTITSLPPCLTCNNGLCMGSCSGTVSLTASPASGYASDGWEYENNAYSGETLSINMDGDKSVDAFFMKTITPQSSLKNQTFSSERMNLYSFTLPEASSIAILSGGALDLKARVLNYYGGAVLDENGSEYSDDYKDIGNVGDSNGHQQYNFMYRKQSLEAGTYTLEVTPKEETTPINSSFSIVFLKKPANSDEFFAGMDALLDDNDDSNDYLDIYVKALWPEFYPTVDSLDASYDYTHNCISDSDGNKPERQCRALVQFYLHDILGKGYLIGTDPEIQSTFWLMFDDANKDCIADNDYIMHEGEGVLTYHSTDSFGSGHVDTNGNSCGSGDYFYHPGNESPLRGSGNLADYLTKGDIFVSNSYGHYGLIYDGSNVLDSNWANPMDGKIHKGTISSRHSDTWKVTRPQ